MTKTAKNSPAKIKHTSPALPYEIRWHGRGGQGAVTASKLLAEIALDLGKHIQAFPQFGSERQGAPIIAYSRIANQPIDLYNTIRNPNIVIILDPSLLEFLPVVDGLDEEGILLVNTGEPPGKLRAALKRKSGVIATVRASEISIRHLGRPITNTAMLGAFIRVTGFQAIDIVETHVSRKFGSLYASDVVEGNISAMREAHDTLLTG